jgi:hypothetical protein
MGRNQDDDSENQSLQARRAVDRRLHHIVKGRCGSAISALLSLRELFGPAPEA